MTIDRPAILFDLGETLFSPLDHLYGERNLLQVADTVGLRCQPEELKQRFRDARGSVARDLSQQDFHLHRKFVSSSLIACFKNFGVDLGDATLRAYYEAQSNAVLSHLTPRSDCFGTLDRLRDHGKTLGIVSNIDNDWLEPLVAKWQLEQAVDLILSSETARSSKPNRRIFEQACGAIECKPSDVVFVGDDEVNDIQGASALGMETVYFAQEINTTPNSSADRVIYSLAELLD